MYQLWNEWNILKKDLPGCIWSKSFLGESSKASDYTDSAVTDLSVNGYQLRKKFKYTFKVNPFQIGF